MNETSGISESRFYMWRAVLAVAHIDDVVTPEETDYLSKAFSQDPLSPGQKQILMSDIQTPQNAVQMFKCISDPQDRDDFFLYAEEVANSDGDYDARERKLIEQLKALNAEENRAPV